MQHVTRGAFRGAAGFLRVRTAPAAVRRVATQRSTGIRRCGAPFSSTPGGSPGGPSSNGGPGSPGPSSNAGSYTEAARARAANVYGNIPSGGEVLQYIHSRDELRRMMNETLKSRSRRMWIGIGAGTAALTALVFVYRHETKKAVVEELSDVASRSLGDEKMQAQAQLVTIQTLQALLEHGETVHRSVNFLSAVAEHEQTRQAMVALLVSALKSPGVLNEALELVIWVLDDARAREHLVTALIAALYNERFQEAAAEFAVHWLSHEDVRATVAATFKEGSLAVLEDASVHATAEQFVKGLLNEQSLQAKTSEHLWAAVRGLVIAPRKAKPPPTRRHSEPAGVAEAMRAAEEATSAPTPAESSSSAASPAVSSPAQGAAADGKALSPPPQEPPSQPAAEPSTSATGTAGAGDVPPKPPTKPDEPPTKPDKPPDDPGPQTSLPEHAAPEPSSSPPEPAAKPTAMVAELETEPAAERPAARRAVPSNLFGLI